MPCRSTSPFRKVKGHELASCKATEEQFTRLPGMADLDKMSYRQGRCRREGGDFYIDTVRVGSILIKRS